MGMLAGMDGSEMEATAKAAPHQLGALMLNVSPAVPSSIDVESR